MSHTPASSDPAGHTPGPDQPPGPPRRGYADVPRFNSAGQAQDYSLANGALVALAGRVLRVETGRSGIGGNRLVIQDLANEQQIETLSFRDAPHLRERAFEAVRYGQLVLAFGLFLEHERKDPEYEGPGPRLELIDLRRLTNPTSMLAPTADETVEVGKLCDQLLATPGALHQHLLTSVRALCGVQTDYLSPRFQLGEQAMLVQALCRGQVPRELNSRLSIYLYSAPGTGKNLLGEYSRILAPLSERVQPALVSAAGISAHVVLGRGGFEARPGVLPMTSGGVCILDDLHRLERRHLNAIQGILMTTLEEGCVKPVKAGSATYEARCGVVLTSNRVSLRDGRMIMALEHGGPQAKASDLVLPFDLFSRTDLVFNLDTGDDAIRTAMKMASSTPSTEFGEEDDENLPSELQRSPREQEIRRLKLLVATVHERIPIVDTSQIEEELEDTMLKMGVVIREYTATTRGVDEESGDGDAFVRRMSVTLRKLVGGLARLDGRSVANADDLVNAWRLLTPKLEVVRWLCGKSDKLRPLPDPEEQVRRALFASEQRWQQVMARYGGLHTQVDQIAAHLQCTEQTARRELAKRNIVGVGGVYLIPTAAEWQRDPRSRLTLSSELVVPPPEVDHDPGEAVPPKQEDGPPQEFDDCLVALPERVKEEIVDQVLRQTDGGQGLALLALQSVALEPTGWAAGQVNTQLGMLVKHEGLQLKSEPLRTLHLWLTKAPDWGERAVRAVSLAFWLMDGNEEAMVQRVYKDALAKGELPPRVQQAFAALQARLSRMKDWLDRHFAAKQALREAEQAYQERIARENAMYVPG